jgi:hypothetical protein
MQYFDEALVSFDNKGLAKFKKIRKTYHKKKEACHANLFMMLYESYLYLSLKENFM